MTQITRDGSCTACNKDSTIKLPSALIIEAIQSNTLNPQTVKQLKKYTELELPRELVLTVVNESTCDFIRAEFGVYL